jgi:hypothetical protein
MQIALSVMPLKSIAHPTKPAPLKPKGAAPAYHPRQITEVVSSSRALPSRRKSYLCATRLILLLLLLFYR